MAGTTWTNEELEFLRSNFENKSCEEIGASLGRSTRSVQHKFGQLGLVRKQPEVGDKVEGTRLTILKKYFKFEHNQNKTYVWVKCSCEAKTEFEVKLASIVSGNTKSCRCLQSEIQRERAIERNTTHGKSYNNILFRRWCNLKFKYQFCKEWLDFNIYEKWCLDNGWTKNHFIRCFNYEEEFNPKNCYIIHKKHSKERIYKIWSGMFVRCYYKKFKQYCAYGGRGIRVCNEWWNYINFRNWSLKNGYEDNLSIDKIDNNYHYCPENCRWATLRQQTESKHNNRQILAFGENKSLIHWTKDNRCKASIDIIKYRLLELGWSTEKSIETVEYQG